MVSRSNGGLYLQSWKKISNVALDNHFITCFNILKIISKSLVQTETLLKLSKAPNPINQLQLELSNLWEWELKLIYDIEWWGTRRSLRVSTIIYNLFIIYLTLVQTYVFSSTRRNLLLDLSLTQYHVKMMAATCQVNQGFQIVSWKATFRLVWTLWKSPWKV